MTTRNSNSSASVPSRKKKVSDEETPLKKLVRSLMPRADIEDLKVLEVFRQDAVNKMEEKTVESLLNIKKRGKHEIKF